MIVEVKNVTKTDKVKKKELITVYKSTLKGQTNTTSGYEEVKFTVTLQSESKEALANWCPLEVGEIRNLKLDTIDKVYGGIIE